MTYLSNIKCIIKSIKLENDSCSSSSRMCVSHNARYPLYCLVFIVTERHTPKYTQNELIRYDIWWINKSSYGLQQQRLTGENHFRTHIFATQSLWIIDKMNACIAIHTQTHTHSSSLSQLEDRKKWFPRIFPSVSPFHNNLFCLMTTIHLHTWSTLSPTTYKLSWAITISQRKYENKVKKKPANRRRERREKANRQRTRDENIHATDYIIYIICAPNDRDDDGCEWW